MEAACNLSPEKSDSTQNYAQARTNVVMETVRAATMATSKKLERGWQYYKSSTRRKLKWPVNQLNKD